MTATHSIAPTLLVAIDISKHRHKVLIGIPGIAVLAEAGDLRRFRHHRQFLKFCGLDLATVQSGMFRGQSRFSKYGNARLRRTLWMAGQTAVLKRTNSSSQLL